MRAALITYRPADDRRRWPVGRYPNGLLAAMFDCETSYSMKVARSRKHEALTVYIAKYAPPTEENQSHNGWTWMRLKLKANSLPDAEDMVKTFLAKNHTWAPQLYHAEL
jgi:hypothetical protein